MPVPSILQKPLPLVAIAEQYWDLTAIPRARAFAVLAKNCSNELEREKLVEFSRYEGQEELFAYANRPRRTILEVLLDFPHATKSLTMEALFELFQPIKPRAFSIASAMESGKLQILVAVIEYKTKLSVPRRGLCSHWLKDLQPGNMVNAWVRKSTFQLPADNVSSTDKKTFCLKIIKLVLLLCFTENSFGDDRSRYGSGTVPGHSSGKRTVRNAYIGTVGTVFRVPQLDCRLSLRGGSETHGTEWHAAVILCIFSRSAGEGLRAASHKEGGYVVEKTADRERWIRARFGQLEKHASSGKGSLDRSYR